jgi:hypothetical protein
VQTAVHGVDTPEQLDELNALIGDWALIPCPYWDTHHHRRFVTIART